MSFFNYRGRNSHGTPVVGRTQRGQSAADAAKDFYERGWTWLVLTDAEGNEVGGIRKLNGTRTWWGEGKIS